ncbi:condensation domain-containing protein [Streptomyces sp. NPDC032940]|uniref:condensation domain-containing protein n=1 Tax=Streptomyces sp. NPDC032940 TaxID=3155366 RepID=UPI0033E22BB5
MSGHRTAHPPTASDAPLAWGQENYWYVRFLRTEGSSKIATSWAVPESASREQVTAAVQELLRRHESLRTTFPQGPDGRPVQRVHPPRPVDVPVLSLEPGQSPAELTSRCARPPMDPETDLPVRFALMTSAGRPFRLIIVVNHIAADGAGIEALWRDFAALLGAGPRPTRHPAARTPGEQARHERSEDLHEHRKRVLDHLHECFSQAPRATFPGFRPAAADTAPAGGASDTTEPATGRPLTGPGTGQPTAVYHKAALRSAHLHARVETLARRHRTLPSLVYLAAYAVLLGAHSGHDRFVLQSSFANRPPELEHVVGCFFQRAPVRIDLTGATTAGLALRAVKNSAMDAWEHAHHSYWDMRDAKARAEAERGHPVRIGVGYNYFASDVLSRAWYIEPDTAPDMTLRWKNPGKTDDALDAHLEVLLDGPVVELSLLAHRSVLDRHTTGTLLHAVTALIGRWAEAPAGTDPESAALTTELGFPPARLPAGWQLAGPSWVNVPRLTECLRSAPGAATARVFAVPAAHRPGRAGLEAYVAGTHRRPGLVPLLDHVRASVAAHADLVPPDRIVLCDRPPHDPDDLRDWQALPGHTRETHDTTAPAAAVRPPRDAAEEALCAAIGRYHPGAEVGTGLPYAAAGGSAAAAVAVARELGRAGFQGLHPEELLSPVPLRTLAARLHR